MTVNDGDIGTPKILYLTSCYLYLKPWLDIRNSEMLEKKLPCWIRIQGDKRRNWDVPMGERKGHVFRVDIIYIKEYVQR